MALIELSGITKTYYMGKETYHALKGIDLIIEPGDLAAIIGPSGSGKSSTMNILGLLDHPTSGRYLLEGQDTAGFTIDQLAYLRNRKIGFVFQSFFLLPRLTALDNIGLPLTYRGLPTPIIRQRAEEMLDRVGMSDLGMHHPYELSGGQQQRVAIARALVGDPSIILADEPTGALDAVTSERILQLLIELNDMEKTTVVIITHDPEVAQRCQRIIRVYDGHIVSEKSS